MLNVSEELILTVLLVPTLLFALPQSYRMFRAHLQNSTLSLVRNVLPLAMMVFLWTFSLGAFTYFVLHAGWQMGGAVRSNQPRDRDNPTWGGELRRDASAATHCG